MSDCLVPLAVVTDKRNLFVLRKFIFLCQLPMLGENCHEREVTQELVDNFSHICRSCPIDFFF